MATDYFDSGYTCRACLENSEDMISIFQVASIMNKSVMLCTVINYCTSLDIFEGDGLPDQLCNKCFGEVTKAFIFKQQFIRADTILRTKLSNTLEDVEIVEDDCTFEQVIIDQETANEKLNFAKFVPLHETAPSETDDIQMKEGPFESNSETEVSEVGSEDKYDPPNDDTNSISESDNETLMQKRDKIKKKLEDIPILKETEELTDQAIRTYISRRKKNKQKYEQAFTCEICAKTLSSAGSLKTHLLIHKAETPFPCSKCGQKFKSKLAYEAHAVTHDPHNPYKCSECGRGFRNDSALEEHKLRAHKGDKPFLCGVCGKGFTQMVALRKHMMIHTGEKPYECETCGKQFRYKNVLILHRRYHTDERPFPCSECDLKFREKTHLRRHLLIHTGVKPYECEFCGKCFNRRTNLKAHRKIHTGEREHICSICGKGFIQQNCLKAHIAGHEKKERKFQQKQIKDKSKKPTEALTKQVHSDIPSVNSHLELPSQHIIQASLPEHHLMSHPSSQQFI